MSEDLSRAPAWTEDDDEEEEETTPRKKQKKGKERVVDLDAEQASGEVSEEESPRSYPPTSEDAAETRKIEEVSLFGTRYYTLLLRILVEFTSMGAKRTTETESGSRERTSAASVTSWRRDAARQSVMASQSQSITPIPQRPL